MKKILFGKNVVVALLLIVILSGWLYRDSFSAYFFQDDWFTLRISQAATLSDFFHFFVPRTDVIYYRPISMQVLFFLLRSVFGLETLPFRLLSFITHVVNICLVFFLARLILKKTTLAILVSTMYATSAVYFIPFYWASTYSFILGPTMFFLSGIYFLLFIDKKRHLYYFLSLIIFLIGLLVNEVVVTMPLIFSLYLLLIKRWKTILIMMPYMVSVAILLYLRFLIFVPPIKGVYQIGFGWHILSNLKTYLFWSFNWSEILTEQMTRPFIFNSLIMKDYSPLAYFSIISFWILTIFIIFGLFLFLKSKKSLSAIGTIIWGFFWYLFGLFPVLFFPHHKFPYYLPISLVGLLVILAVLFGELFNWLNSRSQLVKKCVQFGIVFLWILTSIIEVNFNTRIHWAPRRAKISLRLVEQAKKSYHGELNIYVPSSSENNLSLNNQDGLKVVFGNDDIVTIYGNKVDGGLYSIIGSWKK